MPRRGGLAEQMAHCGAERRLGEIGQRRRHARDRPHAADIGERDEQRRFRLHAAQNPHHLGGTPRCRGGVARLAEQRGKLVFRISAEQTKQARRVGFERGPRGKAPLRRCRRAGSSAPDARSISALSALPEAVRAMLASHSRRARRDPLPTHAARRRPSRRTNAASSRLWRSAACRAQAAASRPRRSGARQSDGAPQAGVVVLELEFAAVQPRDGGGEAQAQSRARLATGSVRAARSARRHGRDRRRECPARDPPP